MYMSSELMTAFIGYECSQCIIYLHLAGHMHGTCIHMHSLRLSECIRWCHLGPTSPVLVGNAFHSNVAIPATCEAAIEVPNICTKALLLLVLALRMSHSEVHQAQRH